MQELPVAPIERNVDLPMLSKTTSFGKIISLVTTLRKLKVGEGFRIDDHGWRGRVTATTSYLGIKCRTTKMNDGKLYVERIK